MAGKVLPEFHGRI